jgi:hypothetical protein
MAGVYFIVNIATGGRVEVSSVFLADFLIDQMLVDLVRIQACCCENIILYDRALYGYKVIRVVSDAYVLMELPFSTICGVWIHSGKDRPVRDASRS